MGVPVLAKLGRALGIDEGGTGATTASAARTALGLAIGSAVQAWSSVLDSWAGKTVPSGTVVGTTDTQTLSNKIFITPVLGAATGDSLDLTGRFSFNGASTLSHQLAYPIGTNKYLGQAATTNHSAANAGSVGLTIVDGGGHSGIFVTNIHDGTYSSQRVTIKTARGGESTATTRVTVDEKGLCGIGTAPEKQLDVLGEIQARGISYPKCHFYSTGNDTDMKRWQLYMLPTSGGGHFRIAALNDAENTESGSLTIARNGNVGIINAAPTARLHLPAGVAAANSAPYKLSPGTVNSIAEAGAGEYDGSSLFFTLNDGIRRQIPLSDKATLPSSITVGASPYTYQNTSAFTQVILTSGGTVSGIEYTRDNTTFYTVAASTTVPVQVSLAPNDRVKITFSSAPTMTRIPL